MATDFELLEGWGQGDKQAANTLFNRHFKAVFRFFRNKLHEGAEDLVQQTFLACIEGRERFRKDSSFRTYLFGTARHVLCQEYKRRRKVADKIDFGVSSIHDLGPSPSRIFVKKGEHRLLLEALRRIALDQQIALELYHFEGLSGPELAEVLNIPEPAVRSRLRRAKEQLRKQIEEIAESREQLESTLANLDDWAASVKELLAPVPDP